MLEDVFETLRGIIWDGMPKNSNGQPTIYEQTIKKWYLGEAALVGTDTPAILIKAEQPADPQDVSFGAREYTYNITIEVYVQATKRENSERFAQEGARLVNRILSNHRRMWVLTICPICQKSALSPEHFTIEHDDILAPYVTDVQAEFDAVWATTHSTAAPAVPDSGLAAAAFLKMYDSIVDDTNPPVTNLDAAARQRILVYKQKERTPVRLLYDVVVGSVKTSDGGDQQQLLYKSEFTLSAKELLRIAEYGPDNVPTDSWERRRT
jgi:hypothetical protein